MSDSKKTDIKKESQPDTPGKAGVDRMAYKQCVEQQKRAGSTNPWAMCNAQFGIGKSEQFAVPVGMSFGKLQKKEVNHIKTDRSDAKKLKAAQKEHMKPPHPQTRSTGPAKVGIKHPVYKTELEPRQSWNQLQKMQSETPLLKKPTK